MATRHAFGDRVTFLGGGAFTELLARARGVVTANSAAGLEALIAGVPVKALASPIFDVVGITDQNDLDGFWAAPRPSDPELMEAFVRAIAATIQERGSIHNVRGLEPAVESMSRRILEDRLSAPDAFVDPPPRLARARALGVPL